MATLQRAHEDRGGSGEPLRLSPNPLSRGSCSLWGYEPVLSILIEETLVAMTAYVEEHWCGDTHHFCQNTLLIK